MYYLAPGRGAKYCDEYVCMFVFMFVVPLASQKHVQTPRNFVHMLLVAVAPLYTSGFVDDVMFARNWLYGAWLIGRLLKVTHRGRMGGEVVTFVISLFLY